MEDFSQLTSWLKEVMKKERNRIHYDKDELIVDLWMEDKKHLKALPLTDLPIYSVKFSTINKYGEIDGKKFVIHKAK